jgi:hypothetical protein
VIWIASAMKFDEAIRSQKDALIAAARAISKDLIQLSAETSASWRGGQPDRVEQVSGIAIAKGCWSRLITGHLTTRSSYAKVAR